LWAERGLAPTHTFSYFLNTLETLCASRAVAGLAGAGRRSLCAPDG
jgi:hypothetical protein